MQLLAVGLNHTTAPVSLREKVAFPADQLGQAVASACAWFGNVNQRPFESAILSTCNRTEIYCAGRQPPAISKQSLIRPPISSLIFISCLTPSYGLTCMHCRRMARYAMRSGSPPD